MQTKTDLPGRGQQEFPVTVLTLPAALACAQCTLACSDRTFAGAAVAKSNIQQKEENKLQCCKISLEECNSSSAAESSTSSGEQRGRAPFVCAGLVASILGSVFFSFSVLCVKLIPQSAQDDDADDAESALAEDQAFGLAQKTRILWYRGLILVLLSGLATLATGSQLRVARQELAINILRSLFAFMACYGAYLSLQFISMGDSTALVFSSPIWTSLLSHFILGEPLQCVQLVALPVSLFGIVLIAHPALVLPIEHAAGTTERQPILLPPQLFNANSSKVLHNFSSIMEAMLEHNAHHADNSVAIEYIGTSLAQLRAQFGRALAQERHHEFLGNLTSLISNWNQDLDAATNAQEHYDLEHRWPGIAIALATSLLVSGQYIVFRLPTRISIQTTIFWIGTTTLTISTIVLCSLGHFSLCENFLPQTTSELLLLVSNGLFSWLGQALLQWGLYYEEASILSVVRTLDVAMTFGLSAVFLEEDILWTSIVGGSIIALVVVVVMLNNFLSKRNKKGTH